MASRLRGDAFYVRQLAHQVPGFLQADQVRALLVPWNDPAAARVTRHGADDRDVSGREPDRPTFLFRVVAVALAPGPLDPGRKPDVGLRIGQRRQVEVGAEEDLGLNPGELGR